MSPTATPPPARIPWTPAVLGGALVLGAVTQLALPPAPPPVEPSAAPGALRRLAVAAVEPALAPPLDYPAVLAHSLFDPARGAATASAPGAAGAPAAGFTLLGTALARGRAAAVVRDGAGAVHTLTPGEVTGGWRLLSVSPRAAALSDGVTVLPLRLGVAAIPGGGAAQPAAQGAAPAPADGGAPR